MKIESLYVFKADDWDEALQKARTVGKVRAARETVGDPTDPRSIVLMFHGIATLDRIGPEIEDKEVWAHISDFKGVLETDWSKVPPQTF